MDNLLKKQYFDVDAHQSNRNNPIQGSHSPKKNFESSRDIVLNSLISVAEKLAEVRLTKVITGHNFKGEK